VVAIAVTQPSRGPASCSATVTGCSRRIALCLIVRPLYIVFCGCGEMLIEIRLLPINHAKKCKRP
jgi:hypothetical protein